MIFTFRRAIRTQLRVKTCINSQEVFAMAADTFRTKKRRSTGHQEQLQRARAAKSASAHDDSAAKENVNPALLMRKIGRLEGKVAAVESQLQEANVVLGDRLKSTEVIKDDLLAAQLALSKSQYEVSKLLTRNSTLVKRAKALSMRIHRAPTIQARAVKKAKAASHLFRLQQKGVITEASRELVTDLVSLHNVPVSRVLSVICSVAATLGVQVDGDISKRSVGRIVLEGGLISQAQIVHEIQSAANITISGDGTSLYNIQQESRFMNFKTSLYSDSTEPAEHFNRFLGISTAVDHTAETQVQGWKEINAEIHDIYNATVGADNPNDLLPFIMRAAARKVEAAGGMAAFNVLPLVEQDIRNKSMFVEICVEVGKDVFNALSPEEQRVRQTSLFGLAPAPRRGSAAADSPASSIESPVSATVDTVGVFVGSDDAHANGGGDGKSSCAVHRICGVVGALGGRPATRWRLGVIGVVASLSSPQSSSLAESSRSNHMAKGCRASVMLCGCAQGEVWKELAYAFGMNFGAGVPGNLDLPGTPHNSAPASSRPSASTQTHATAHTAATSSARATPHTRYVPIARHPPVEVAGMASPQNKMTPAPFALPLAQTPIPSRAAAWTQPASAGVLIERQMLGTPRQRRELKLSSEGGGVKLTSLAGMLFHHKDKKKGEGALFHIWFEDKLGYDITFPDTSNTRYQSHCEAAGALLTHKSLFLGYLEHMRDRKGSRLFTNVEKNVYDGLMDPATNTELLVLATYGALETWLRFTEDYAAGGTIANLTPVQRARAHMPPTNDANEGTLGEHRTGSRHAPNMSLHQHNAHKMYKRNNTKHYRWCFLASKALRVFRAKARMVDSSGLTKKNRKAQQDFDTAAVEVKHGKDKVKSAKLKP
ncbi:hypothetical protein B0H14DRAFT_3458644 [Mycena olivaceomarginata]|nr:hypothetical protein B0H14DRAFT_3458644 [Mycena olivaceomarginata]